MRFEKRQKIKRRTDERRRRRGGENIYKKRGAQRRMAHKRARMQAAHSLIHFVVCAERGGGE